MGLLLVLTAVVELIVIPLISKTNCCISSVFLSVCDERATSARLWPHPLALLRCSPVHSPTIGSPCRNCTAGNIFCCGRNGWIVMASFQTCRLAWFKMQLLSGDGLLCSRCHSLRKAGALCTSLFATPSHFIVFAKLCWRKSTPSSPLPLPPKMQEPSWHRTPHNGELIFHRGKLIVISNNFFQHIKISDPS